MKKHVFDEKRIKVLDCGYNYVEVTPEEVLNWGGYCVCNGCNGQFLNKNMYLIYLLSDTYCEDCFKERIRSFNTMSHEDIDSDLELQNRDSLDWYKYHLDDDFRAKIIRQNEESNHYSEHVINMINDSDFEEILKELTKDEN